MTDSTFPEAPYAFVFPGQGSQFVGMATPHMEQSKTVQDLFAMTDEVLDFPLTELIANGPAEALEDTLNAQPAILATSVAAMALVTERAEATGQRLEADYVAGHSLGEFTALIAAGVLDFPTGLRLVRERGRLMKEAGQTRPGGMAAILGLDDDAIAEVCAATRPDGIVVPANRNCPGQIVISGEINALQRAMDLAKARGARRVARLNVSIASHSPLMADANREFQRLLAEVELTLPDFPERPSGVIVGNVSAKPIYTTGGLREELDLQMERPVNWTGSIQSMLDAGVRRFIEIGPGSILSGLIKRISSEAQPIGMQDLGFDIPALSTR